MHYKLCFVGFLVLSLKHCAMATSQEAFKLRFVQSILECSGDFPVSSAQIQSLKQKEIPDDMNVKCLLACAYKKSGMMDNEGKLSVEGIKKISNELFADRPDLIKISEDFTEECKFVNNEEFHGDKKECERARMIYKCSMEKANKFDITTS